MEAFLAWASLSVLSVEGCRVHKEENWLSMQGLIRPLAATSQPWPIFVVCKGCPLLLF